jgi:predicted esterase
MGGGLSLQFAFRTSHRLGGVFALSSYLNNEAAVFKQIEARAREGIPPAFMRHGTADGFILPAWGSKTATRLSMLGVNVQFDTIDGLEHSLCRSELKQLSDWFCTLFPCTDGIPSFQSQSRASVLCTPKSPSLMSTEI